jgi:hypothetical protein
VGSLTVGNTAKGGIGGGKTSASGVAGAGGDANASTTISNTGGTTSATAIATGGTGGAGASGAGGGAGGLATVFASASNTTSSTVTVSSQSSGGVGGTTTSSGGSAAPGGTSTASAFGSSSGGAAVNITVSQGGGRGGSQSGAVGNGGNGAASTLTNGASGSTSGTLTLTHAAIGGEGGIASGAASGNGGDATSTLTATNPGGGPIVGTTNANSGAGGNGSGPATPGNGGNSVSTINLSSTTSTVSATAASFTGFGGTNGAASGLRGIASSSAHATTTNGLVATAIATASGRVAPAASAASQSDTASGVLTSMSLLANVQNTSALSTQTVARTGAGFATLFGGSHGELVSAGLPSAGDVTAQLAGDPNVTAAYNPPDGHHTPLALGYFGLNTLNGTPTASPTISSTANYSFDISTLTNGNLMVGLLDPITAGTGFTSLHFQVTREGSIVVDQMFATLATAVTYFDDHVLDLGPLAAGVVGTLDLSIHFDMLSPDTGTKFRTTLLVADVGLIAGTPGDYNNNGTVEAGDFVLWSKYQGTTHVLPNDPTGGTIGAAQYTTWRSNFGKPPGSGADSSANAAVPEPTSLVLLILSAAGSCLRQRRCG